MLRQNGKRHDKRSEPILIYIEASEFIKSYRTVWFKVTMTLLFPNCDKMALHTIDEHHNIRLRWSIFIIIGGTLETSTLRKKIKILCQI